MWRGQSVAATKKIIKMKSLWALKAQTAASVCLFTTRGRATLFLLHTSFLQKLTITHSVTCRDSLMKSANPCCVIPKKRYHHRKYFSSRVSHARMCDMVGPCNCMLLMFCRNTAGGLILTNANIAGKLLSDHRAGEHSAARNQIQEM